jgi:opacity protein-like surface antigen
LSQEGNPIRMRKIGFLFFSLAVFAGLANAQIPTSGNVFFGYSYLNADLNAGTRTSSNGWEASFEGKVLPFVGLVADFDAHYGSQPTQGGCVSGLLITCGTFSSSFTEHSFLFGPRVSVSLGKLRPFGEALFGGSHISSAGNSDTSFATALGGGLDYKIVRPVAWRFQGDYVQTRFFGLTQNNARFSTGIVLRF